MNKNLLITGGAGFIGVNAAIAFARDGWKVTVLDNLSRTGAATNLEWLRGQADIQFVKCDIRDWIALDSTFKENKYGAILHLAAQVAVTTSISNPREDFEINALGTFNLLEAVRLHSPDATFVYASTNKVYGKMEDVTVIERNGRYNYALHTTGIEEDRQLDFHSPYGCSKGAGDQYVIDYSRIYGLRATTFRQSCIYGPRQFGVEDQGWVAWFSIASVLGRPITIYGDGKQIRDVLHVSDLVRAYKLAFENPDCVSGQSFNIGGGPKNTLSLLELLVMLEEELGKKIPRAFDEWRAGDQKVFVCNLDKSQKAMQWQPEITVQAGVQRLIQWVSSNNSLFR
jgi:CDP-paratose 2-epimerase